MSSYLPRWGRLAGVQVQIEVLHLLVALWLHHGTTPTVCRHGCAELHVLRQRKPLLKGGGGTEAVATAEPYNSIALPQQPLLNLTPQIFEANYQTSTLEGVREGNLSTKKGTFKIAALSLKTQP